MNKSNQKTANQMLEEVSEMIKQVENCKGPLQNLKQPASVKEELEMIKKFMIYLDEYCDTLQPLEEASIPEEQKQLISKGQEIEGKVKLVHEACSKAITKKRGHSKKSKNKRKTDPKVKERKKLFKSIGGDKKWIPL